MTSNSQTRFPLLITTAALAASLLVSVDKGIAQQQKVDAEEFIRIPPKSPEEELKHLHIKPGFRLELVAAEPLVEDPVAICFDESWRLFVAELHDHQHLPDPHTSKVKMLTDEDGDGRYDKAVTLAEGLGWITAIAPWDGGVFIGASPDLIYLKDTTGDGKADVKVTVLSGFDHDKDGKKSKSYHHERSLNNFNWGLGNRFYCAGGMNGGFIKNIIHPELPAMTLKKLDFSFDPRKLSARPETGSSQHGMAIDDWGNRYQTTNSNPVLYPSYDLRYRLRNPGAALPSPMASIARPDPKGPVFRRSRTEPWREARTRLRASGLERGPIEKGGSVSGYFTGTADSAIYRGVDFPVEYRGALFVGEVSENVVHHREIRFPTDRVEPDALRPADESDYEFIASSDNWFRPVQIINGPKGFLYITDMYREVVEAWHTIPEYIREHLDRDSGKDRGRIWRVVSSPRGAELGLPMLDKADTPTLIAFLNSKDGWERDTASRLLYQRQNLAGVPRLEKLLKEKPVDPRTVLHVLYALDGLNSLKSEHVIPFLKSSEPWLRIHALRLLEKLKNEEADVPLTVLAALADDSDPRVLYQLAFTLGDYDDGGTSELFYQIATKLPQDEWLAMAVASSAGKEGISKLLSKFMAGDDRNSAALLASCREAGRLKLPLPKGFLDFEASTDKWIGPLEAYVVGLKSARAKFSDAFDSDQILRIQARCLQSMSDESATVGIRVQCLRMIPYTKLPEPMLTTLLGPFFLPGIPAEYQDAAVEVFRTGARSRQAGEVLVDLLPQADTRLRPSLIHLMTRRSSWCVSLLEAVQNDKVKAMEIPAADAAYLRGHSDAAIAKLATELLPAPPDRGKVVAQFQAALSLQGDGVAGEKIFRERCLICHQFGNEGGQVGPAMGEFQKHGKGQILLNFLDPNKTVQPDYLGYVLTTSSGEVVLGRVIEDTTTGVKMRDSAGQDRDFPRSQIASLVSTGRTLMPEGIEVGLEPGDVANLLEFITGKK